MTFEEMPVCLNFCMLLCNIDHTVSYWTARP